MWWCTWMQWWGLTWWRTKTKLETRTIHTSCFSQLWTQCQLWATIFFFLRPKWYLLKWKKKTNFDKHLYILKFFFFCLLACFSDLLGVSRQTCPRQIVVKILVYLQSHANHQPRDEVQQVQPHGNLHNALQVSTVFPKQIHIVSSPESLPLNK